MENTTINVIIIGLAILTITGMWKTFIKAEQPGWASIIPIYNIYILLKIAKKPGWWLILYLIPIINFIIRIVVDINIARNFGKGVGFGLGLFFLPFIFYPILGFSDADYIG